MHTPQKLTSIINLFIKECSGMSTESLFPLSFITARNIHSLTSLSFECNKTKNITTTTTTIIITNSHVTEKMQNPVSFFGKLKVTAKFPDCLKAQTLETHSINVKQTFPQRKVHQPSGRTIHWKHSEPVSEKIQNLNSLFLGVQRRFTHIYSCLFGCYLNIPCIH